MYGLHVSVEMMKKKICQYRKLAAAYGGPLVLSRPFMLTLRSIGLQLSVLQLCLWALVFGLGGV